VKARDAVTLEESAFSAPHSVAILIMEIPAAPDGHDVADINELVMFTFVGVHAPYSHDVMYFVNWGDNLTTDWIGPYPSGLDPNQPIEVYHNWDELGTYAVKVKAKDAVTGDESVWSPVHNISIGSTGPLFSIVGVSGGRGFTVSIQNKLAPSKYVDYTSDVAGGQMTGLHVHKYFSGNVYIPSGSTVQIGTGSFFSFGRTRITVSATAAGEPVAHAVYEAFTLFTYVLNVHEIEV